MYYDMWACIFSGHEVNKLLPCFSEVSVPIPPVMISSTTTTTTTTTTTEKGTIHPFLDMWVYTLFYAVTSSNSVVMSKASTTEPSVATGGNRRDTSEYLFALCCGEFTPARYML